MFLQHIEFATNHISQCLSSLIYEKEVFRWKAGWGDCRVPERTESHPPAPPFPIPIPACIYS